MSKRDRLDRTSFMNRAEEPGGCVGGGGGRHIEKRSYVNPKKYRHIRGLYGPYDVLDMGINKSTLGTRVGVPRGVAPL